MAWNKFRHKIEGLLEFADVKIGGDRPWDIQIHNEDLYARVMTEGSLGLGEAYMDGAWDCLELDEFFYRVWRTQLDSGVRPWRKVFAFLQARVFNLQKPSRAFEVGQRHYDIGNDLYQCMLDRRLIYSCGYWKDASNLDEAQEAKLDLICRKLNLEPGMRVLDTGCGWGGTAQFAAERYGVEVVGITVSKEQVKFGKELCQGLPVEIRLQDYRRVEEKFDRILSVGMFEHVGYRNYGTFMRLARRCLKDEGLFLLHSIGGTRSNIRGDPWLQRYIFPNAMLPSAKQISGAMEGTFMLEDWHNFGADYDKTLMEWFRNFHACWDGLKDRYDERFYRMWKYYLLATAGSFRARRTQLWQLVLSPSGVPGGYRASR